MAKVHKRNKRTRLRGSRSAGTGFRKKKKGHGNKGGHGWSGTGKRGSQKQQMALMYAQSLGFDKYFGKRGLTSAPTTIKKTEQINLDDIKANFFLKEGQKIELKGHKVLGDGVGFNAEIHAASASQSAIDKMAKAGGKIILPVRKVDTHAGVRPVGFKKAEAKAGGKKVAPVSVSPAEQKAPKEKVAEKK